jgi:predicted GNAT family N-acyltransferase
LVGSPDCQQAWELREEVLRRPLGLSQVELHARLSAVGFYRGLGYAVVGQEFQELGIPHLKMKRRLGGI